MVANQTGRGPSVIHLRIVGAKGKVAGSRRYTPYPPEGPFPSRSMPAAVCANPQPSDLSMISFTCDRVVDLVASKNYRSAMMVRHAIISVYTVV